MKNKILKLKVKVAMIFTMTYLTFSNITVNAKSLTDNKVVKGAKELFKDGLTVVQVLIGAAAGLAVAWQLFKLQGEEDEGAIRAIKKRIKTILIATIAGEVVATIISVVTGYFV